MGRTVPSFRIAAEIERTKWSKFRSYLDKGERKMFDQMYEYFNSHSAACGNACKPVVIHPILMSILFQHYKQLTKLMEQKNAKEYATSNNTLDMWT
jgi:hypothetical protein